MKIKLYHSGEVLPSPYTPNPFAKSQRDHLARLRKAPKPAEIAAMLRARIPDAPGCRIFQFDGFKVIDSPESLEAAASLVTRSSRRRPSGIPRDAYKDALSLYGTARNAADTIERHLDTLGGDIDPGVRERAEKLLLRLRGDVLAEDQAALRDALPDETKAVLEERNALSDKVRYWKLKPKRKNEIRKEIESLNGKLAELITDEATARAVGIPFLTPTHSNPTTDSRK